LADDAARADNPMWFEMRDACPHSQNIPKRRRSEMSNNETERPKRNITWQTQPMPASCEHQYEVIAHEEPNPIQRCVKCGNLTPV
jgi:hypothetical protein